MISRKDPLVLPSGIGMFFLPRPLTDAAEIGEGGDGFFVSECFLQGCTFYNWERTWVGIVLRGGAKDFVAGPPISIVVVWGAERSSV